eukprot:5954059-Alexandrium_andersonii.AAC.1
MPTASNQSPNSRNGPTGTPALIRAGAERVARCSRTAREAAAARGLSSGAAPVPLPIPKAAA